MIQFAVVGCGHIGMRHIEMIQQNPYAQLVAVCDISSEKLKSIDVTCSKFSSLQELLEAHLQIDVVSICTPNGYHAEQAILSLESYYNVVVEKPLAISSIDAQRIISTAEKVGKQVFCVMQNRYSPPSVWLKSLIDSHTLGNIYMVEVNCYWNRDERYYTKGNWHGSKQLDGGTLFTQFSHFVDIMYWLFGDITNIRGDFHNFSHKHVIAFEDSGVVSFDFVRGGMGCLTYSTSVWNTNLESSITIIAESGTVKVSGQYMDKVEYCHIKDYKMPQLSPSNPPNDYGAYKGSAQNHQYIIQNVVDTLQHTATATTNVYDGMKVVDIIERIYKVRDNL